MGNRIKFDLTFSLQIILIIIANYYDLFLLHVSANPPLLPEEDTGLGLNNIYDARKSSVHANKTLEPFTVNTSVEAKHYDLSIRVNLMETGLELEKSFTTSSSIKILCACNEPTDLIVLNANTKDALLITEDTVVVIDEETKERLLLESTEYAEDSDYFIIKLSSPCKKGNDYTISMQYIGTILNSSKSLDGLYYSHYEEDDETKYLAVTQFESEAARKTFPSFDRPDDKASFTVKIGRLNKYNSLSNMKIVKTEPIEEFPGWYWDFYDETPLMSTYLVAIIVSEYNQTTADPSLYRKPVLVAGPREEISRGGGEYSAKTAAKLLEFYERLFEIDYPLPQMVSAAIPQFAAGAMENWGLNTYRFGALLYYNGESTEAQRESITTVVAHELAHQWFGNLVTCKFWNQIWLNEGFATFVQYFGVQAVNPEFESMSTWYTDVFQRALRADERKQSHALVNTSESFGHFDTITYQKGASLLFMLRAILTPETLFAALRSYLRTYAFGNTVQSDLFSVLEKVSKERGTHPGFPLTEIMEPWTLQPGFPLIYISRKSSKAYYISQGKYSVDVTRSGENVINDNEDRDFRLWRINLHIISSYDPNFTEDRRSTVWLSNDQGTLLWTSRNDTEWILLKTGTVFGRIIYDDKVHENIVRQLNSDVSKISPMNRAQLLDDYFTVAYARNFGVSIVQALHLTEYLSNENTKVVWTTVMTHLRKPFNMFSSRSWFGALKRYLLPRFSDAMKRHGLSHSSGSNAILRVNLLNWCVALEDPYVLNHASKIVNSWMNQMITNGFGQNIIPVDLRGALYCGAVANGDISTWEFLLDQTTKHDEYHRMTIWKSLACTKNINLIERMLKMTVDPLSDITKKETLNVLQKLTESSVGREYTYDFLTNNIHEMVKKFSGIGPIVIVVDTISTYWNTQAELEKLTKFLDSNSEQLEHAEELFKRSTKNILDNIEWMQYFSKDMSLWFLSHMPTNEIHSTSDSE